MRVIHVNEATFVTSDQHFGCSNALRYRHRPFGSVEEMNDALVDAWNDVVDEDGVVLHLGDLSVNDQALLTHVPRLNGSIILIPGNHDVMRSTGVWGDEALADKKHISYPFLDTIEKCENGAIVCDVSYPGWREFFACHYPIQRHSKLPTVCGHVHDLWKVARNMVNVSCDAWHFRPVRWITVRETFEAMFRGHFDANVFPDAPLAWQTYVSGLRGRSDVEPTMDILERRALDEGH